MTRSLFKAVIIPLRAPSHFLLLRASPVNPLPLFSSPPQGKKNSVFRECYFGSQRHCKVTRLYPACGYTFRMAAHNDIGTRYWLKT